jgi:hypothetical protein
MDNEINSITTLQVFDSLPIPPHQKCIQVKWVYKIARDKKGNILNYKARVVVMGFFQREGIDVHETFTPVSNYYTLRFLISYCTTNNIEITHIDVKTAFLNAPLSPAEGVTVKAFGLHAVGREFDSRQWIFQSILLWKWTMLVWITADALQSENL